MTELDQSLLRWFVDHREPWLTSVVRIVTTLGGSGLLIPLVLALGAWYWRRRQSLRPLALLGAAYTGAFVLSHTIKALVDRARPPALLAIGSYDSPSLPSGHATYAAAVWTMVAVVVAAGTTRRWPKVAVWVAAGAIIGTVGITRLYLAAHWLTDVVAGWAIGAVWTLLVVRARGKITA